MHHRHGVFDGDGLTTGGLNIQLGTAKAWENKRLFTHQQMGTVQLSTNVNTQIKVTHCREAVLVIGHRDGKVTAEADKRFRPTVDHGLGSPAPHHAHGEKAAQSQTPLSDGSGRPGWASR